MPHGLSWLLHIQNNLNTLINQLGVYVYLVIAGVIFAETALVILPFLPGDSLLIPLGLFCQTGKLNLWVILFTVPLAAVAGDFINFHIGKFFGAKIFTPTSKGIFKQSNLEHTRDFFQHHGQKAIIVGRFIPVIRSLAPFVAGMEGMPKRKFVPTSIVAAFFWVWSCVFIGFFFGTIPGVKDNFERGLLGLFGLMTIFLVGERWIHHRIQTANKQNAEAAKANVPKTPAVDVQD